MSDITTPSKATSNHGLEPDPRRWFALSVLIIAGFMDLVDVTIVNVALPTIQRDLKAAYVDIEWVVSAYVLGFAALLVTGGRLGDLVGRRRIMLVGLAGFVLASLACGIASTVPLLIAARFAAGAMGGLMIPQILAIMHVTFPPGERPKALGIWGGALGAASVAGLVLGGVLIDWNPFDLSWRTIFLVNLPIGLAALVAVYLLVAESRSDTASRIDIVGTILAVAAILLLVFPLTEGRSLGWPVWTYLMMAASVLVGVLFLAWERHRTRTVGSPLLALSLFKVRAFAVGMPVWALFWIASGGFYLVWTLYLQPGLGWSPLCAGLTASLYAVAASAASAISVQVLVARFGRYVLIAGALINAAGFAVYAFFINEYGPTISSTEMIVPLVISGFGFGLLVAPLVDLVLADVPADEVGSASGVLSTVQQVGMALGVALAGVVFFSHLQDNADHASDAVVATARHDLTAAGLPPASLDGAIARFRQCVRERSATSDPTAIPVSCQMPQGAPALATKLAPIFADAGREANAHNFSDTFVVTLWYGTGLLTVTGLAMLALPNRRYDPRAAAHRETAVV